MARAIFLVDGFNLYHSLVEASKDRPGLTTKWLDLHGLCRSYLPLVGERSGDRSRAELAGVDYFSATPWHHPQDTIDRFNLYMRCLRSSGVVVNLGRFRRKDRRCKVCGAAYISHEEKETDVAIAIRLFEVCHSDEAEVIVLMTGDTDLAPAVVSCKRLFPQKLIFFAFPYRRFSSDLRVIARESFHVKLDACRRHQFPDPLVLSDGTAVSKPATW